MKPPISRQITRVYALGIGCLMVFFYLVLEIQLHAAQDEFAARRLAQIGTETLARYQQGYEGPLRIDALTQAYDRFRDLPELIKNQTSPEWLGGKEVDLELGEDEISYLLLAQPLAPDRILYLVEDTSHTEAANRDVTATSLRVLALGIYLALILAFLVNRAAARLAAPVVWISQHLDSPGDDREPLVLPMTGNRETDLLLEGVNHYKQRLREALRRERSFTRYASHELRTPLTVVKGITRLLQNQESSPALVRYRRQLAVAVEEMTLLIDTFLLLARDDRAGEVKPVSLDETFVRNLMPGLEPIRQVGSTEFSFEQTTPCRIAASPVLLRVVVGNLLKNAFTHAAGGRVQLCAHAGGFYVEDSGPQTSASGGENTADRENQESHGIGLVIVRDICARYGWAFVLTTQKDGGSRAEVCLGS